MKYVLLCFFAVVLSACVTVGKEVTQEQLGSFKKGQTTIDDVITKLGPPTSSSLSGSGVRTISYVFSHAQARPSSFIPFVGLFIGGTDARSSSVVLIFGSDGKLQDFHSAQSQFGSGTGLAAGGYQQKTLDQPKEAKFE